MEEKKQKKINNKKAVHDDKNNIKLSDSKDNKKGVSEKSSHTNSNETEKQRITKPSFFSVHKIKIIIITCCLVLIIAIINSVVAISGIKKIYTNYISKYIDIDGITLIADDKRDSSKKEEPVPNIIPRKLDGMMVSRADANLVPACVMIENAAFGGVRPQSGLSQALVVYEVIVEGGITRFMAVFAGEKSDVVGPVRSARDTYLEFASEMNCAYFHAGGSYTAINALYNLKMRDVDGLREYSYFWRDSNKVSPHNFFTSTENLTKAIKAHNWSNEEAPNFKSWNFVDKIKVDDNDINQTTNKINIAFGGSYDVEYNYNEENKYYERKNGGIVHTDAINGKQLTARNIIIQHVGSGIYIEGKGRVNWPVTGIGTVDIIREGIKTTGIWQKENRLARTIFLDNDGNEIQLVRGNSWVEIVPEDISIEFE